MLHLKLPSDPRWVNIAERNIEDILIDHAYCEQKAASSCISLIIQYPERERLVNTLTPIVKEEWEHFEQVLEQLKKRGYKLGKARKDEYVNALLKHIRKGLGIAPALTDKLLVAALIEARSCERFKLLASELQDSDLRQFYHKLMVSEARHYTTFIQLARHYQDRPVVDARWQEWLFLEADIIQTLKPRGDRMH